MRWCSSPTNAALRVRWSNRERAARSGGGALLGEASAVFLAAVELVALDLGNETFAADAELARELRLVPAGLAQTFGEDAALDFFQDLVEGLVDADAFHVRAHRLLFDASGEVLGVDDGLFAAENDEALDLVLELADVAGPLVVVEALEDFLGHFLDGGAALG